MDPDLEVSFVAKANHPYVVNVGAWIECDNTSGAGVSGGSGKIDGKVLWLVVEQRVT